MSEQDRISGFVWVNAGGPLLQLQFYDGILIAAELSPVDSTEEPQVRYHATIAQTASAAIVGTSWFLDGVAVESNINAPPYDPPEEPQPRFTGAMVWDRLAGGSQEIEFFDGVAIAAEPALNTSPTPMPTP